MRKTVDFGVHGALSCRECATLCQKSVQTIYRWQREGWPAPYWTLCELHASGRVMPLKWRYVRFDSTGRLATMNAQISENDVLNVPQMLKLLDQQNQIIQDLEKQRAELRALINELTAKEAANDHLA